MPAEPLSIDAWSEAARDLLVGLAGQGMALTASSFDDGGVPHAVAMRRARFGVNLELSRRKDGGWFWLFRGRRDATDLLLARARILFALGPRFTAGPAPAAMRERRMMPSCVLPGLDPAMRQRLAGPRATADNSLVFARAGVPCAAWRRDLGWVMPDGRVTGEDLPVVNGLVLMHALADARPSLWAEAGGTPGAAGAGPAAPVQAARALIAAHRDADVAMAALAAPDQARRIGLAAFGMDQTRGVIEFALRPDGTLPEDSGDLEGAMRIAIAVDLAPDASGEALLLTMSLGPPDVLADGAVFDAFAEAIAAAAGRLRAELGALAAGCDLADPGQAQLVMRHGAADRRDRNIVAWGPPGAAPALFTVSASVEGGSLAPKVTVEDPEPVEGRFLPEDLSARLLDIAAVMKSWVGAAA